MTDDVLRALGGPALGVAFVYLIRSAAYVLRRRAEARAESESAAAKAVTELVAQLAAVRSDLSREVVARVHVEDDLAALKTKLTAEKDLRRQHESEAVSLANQLATETALREEAQTLRDKVLAEIAAPLGDDKER